MAVERMDAGKKGSRRDFLAAAAAGTGLLLGTKAIGQEAASPPLPAGSGAPATAPAAVETVHSANDLRVAMIGVGYQGQMLVDCLARLSDVRVVALCDIWEYSRKRVSRFLEKHNQPNTVYTDYRDLLAKEEDLDAVIVATPDFLHAEQTIACMNAGLHVYCETPISHNLAEARRMMRVARDTGRLLQIGYQRRSHPRYIHAIQKLICQIHLLGRVTNGYSQWNRCKMDDIGWPKKYELSGELLKKYGYDTMQRFRNWRTFRQYAGGPAFDRGTHQFDVFNWALGGPPVSVYATGGCDPESNREWFDNLIAVMEYATPKGLCRTHSEILDTSSYGGYYERICGEDGTLVISQVVSKGNYVTHEPGRRDWTFFCEEKLIEPEVALPVTTTVNVGPSGPPKVDAHPLPINDDRPLHLPHLQNFFDAIRGRATLTCPPEIGYQAAAVAELVNKSIKKRRPLKWG